MVPKKVDDSVSNSVVRKTKGRSNPVDAYVGGRLRLRRTLLGLSQEKLAEAIGLTFQQVQKYERGTNRISASRLFQFAKILDVPVSYFFDQYEGSDHLAQPLEETGLADNRQEAFAEGDDLMKRKETIDLVRVYYSLENEKLRKDLYKLVKTMAENMQDKD